MAKYIDMMLPCKLTEPEIQEKVRKLVSFKQDLRGILLDEAQYKAEIKRRKEEVEPTIGSLEREITEESEQRRVRCQMVYDSENFTVATVRTDTWEQVGKARQMTQEEIDGCRQLDLVREVEAKAAAPAPDGADSDPQSRDEDEAAQEPQEGPGDPDALVIADDAPDGGQAPKEGQEGAAEGEDAPMAAPEAESPVETSQDGQEAPAAGPDDWENIEPARETLEEGEEKASS